MDKAEFKELMTEPAHRKDSFQITIKRFFTDVNGVIIDKNDVTIPAALQTQYPVYLFGQYDRAGAYYLALKNTPPQVGTEYLCSFVYGINNPLFFGFTGLSTIQLQLKPGDLVTVFTDSLLAPNIFVWMVQHSPNKPLASFISNMPNLEPDPNYGKLKSLSFDYYCSNDQQWEQNMQWIKYDYTGLVHSNNIEPIIYRTPDTPVIGFLQVKWVTNLSQYLGLNFYYLFDTDSITLNFLLKIKK